MTKMIVEMEMPMPRAALELMAGSIEQMFKDMAEKQGVPIENVSIRFE